MWDDGNIADGSQTEYTAILAVSVINNGLSDCHIYSRTCDICVAHLKSTQESTMKRSSADRANS